MTHTQNVEAIITQLMEEEQKLSSAYEEAEERNNHAYEKVLTWEEAYTASDDDEKVAQIFDDVYDEYSETEEQVEAIDEALEELHNATKAIGRLSL